MSFALATVLRFTIVLLCAGITTMALKRSAAAIRCALWTVALLCGLLVPMTDVLLPQPGAAESTGPSREGNRIRNR